MKSAYEEILVRETQWNWMAMLKSCKERLRSEAQEFSLEACLQRALNGKVNDAFRKDAKRFLERYEFTETCLSMLGTLIWLEVLDDRERAFSQFRNGVDILKRKQPEPTGISYLGSGKVMIGLLLGSSGAYRKDAEEWQWAESCMQNFMANRQHEMKWQVLGYWALGALLDQSFRDEVGRLVMRNTEGGSASSLALLWGMERIIGIASHSKEMMEKKCDLISSLAEVDVDSLDVLDWIMLEETLAKLLKDGARLLPIKDMEFLIGVLQKFPQCLKREKENLRNEYDVQRILWTMLRPYYDDLVDEEYLRKFGLKNYRIDIGIRSLRTIIEAKFVGPKGDPAKFQDQILADTRGYLEKAEEFDRLIIFIYDCSRKLAINTRFCEDLEGINGVEKVIVIPEVQIE